MKKLEVLLWILAVVLLTAYGLVWLDREVYQAYRDWEFERALASRRPVPAAPAPAEPVTPKESVVGRIEIPRLGVRAMILEGTSEKALRRAVGHIEGTALPGESGNVGLAAHRDTFFGGLKKIKKKDRIRLRTLDGEHTYVVDSIKIVDPEDVEVLNATTEPTLTLVTCYPFNYVGDAPERYIVRARRVEPKSDGNRLQALQLRR